jgi:uncharacterized protein
MKFEGEITVPGRRDAVFEKLNDPHFFASSIDGVRDLVEVDATHYTATLETRIAYIKFKFEISVELATVEPPMRVVARAEGRPLGVVGRLSSTSSATLREDGSNTVVAYEIDVAMTGKLGSFGQPVIKSKAKEMEREFARNLIAAFAPSAEAAR